MTRRRRPEPNEITEMWKDFRREGAQRRAVHRLRNAQPILALQALGYKIRDLNQGIQFRINETVDLYPTSRKYHVLRTNERGRYKDLPALLRRIVDNNSRP